MTALKFMGSVEDLRQLLRRNDLSGHWETQPNGVYMWRYSAGGNLHWSSTTKSLWFSGKPVCRDPLAAQIQKIIGADAPHTDMMDDDDDDDIDLDID